MKNMEMDRKNVEKTIWHLEEEAKCVDNAASEV